MTSLELFRKSDLLESNLRTTAEIRRGFVNVYFHWLYFCLFMFPIALRLVDMIEQEVRTIPPYLDNLYYIFRIALFYVALFTYCPLVARWATLRNIPIVVTTYLFFAVHSLISALFGHAVFEYPPTIPETLQMFFRHMVLAVMVHTLAVLYYEQRFRSAIGRDAQLLPFWRPLPVSLLSSVSAKLIDPALSGRLLYMQAQNQYVSLGTDAGLPLVRMTFSKAVEKLPAAGGKVVHRSWWVSSAAARDMRLDAKAEELVMQDGTRIPVSKTKLAEVEAWLKQLGAA